MVHYSVVFLIVAVVNLAVATFRYLELKDNNAYSVIQAFTIILLAALIFEMHF